MFLYRRRQGPGLSRYCSWNRTFLYLQRAGQGRYLFLIVGCRHRSRLDGYGDTDGHGLPRESRRHGLVGAFDGQRSARENGGCLFDPGDVLANKARRGRQNVTGRSQLEKARYRGKRIAHGFEFSSVGICNEIRCPRHGANARRLAFQGDRLLGRCGRSCRPCSLCSPRVNLRDLNLAVVLPVLACRQLAHQLSSTVSPHFVDVLPSIFPVGDEDRHLADRARTDRVLLVRHFRLLLTTLGEHGCRDQQVGDAVETHSNAQRSSGSISHLSLLSSRV